jgi:cyclomaltodextrinase
MMNEPAWVEQTIWWHVYPLGFVGAPASGEGQTVTPRFNHILGWLDYARALGATGVFLGPIFSSGSHGYDTTDHLQIDPRLGDDAAFDVFVHEVKKRGLRLMLDGVFHHVGQDFVPFQRVIQSGPGSPEEEWFHLHWTEGAVKGDIPTYRNFEGHASLVKLNHDAPCVRDYITKVMLYWLERGIDAWRLDAAYAVDPSVWVDILTAVRNRYPEAYFVGEVIHGNYAGYIKQSGLDSLTQYELWKAIWSSLNDLNFFELRWALWRHNETLKSFIPMTFLGNHDVTRLASQLVDDRHLAHALVLLATLGGTPVIYAGDEQAFRGVKEHRAGGDDAIRPAFPSTPEDLAPFGWWYYQLHQELLKLRKVHRWLHWASTEIVHMECQHLCMLQQYDGKTIAVALNISDQSWSIYMKGNLLKGSGVHQKANTLQLEPQAWGVLLIPS